MNNYSKEIFKGLLIALLIIVYWILIGIVPKIFVEIYQNKHEDIVKGTIIVSIFIYLILVSYTYNKIAVKSVRSFLLISCPYILFLLLIVIISSNLPRLVDIIFILFGITIIYCYFKKKIDIKKVLLVISLYCIVLTPLYVISYDNILYLVSKNKMLEEEKLDSFNLKIIDKNGKILVLSDFKDKTILVDMWSSACGNCIKSMPDFEKLNSSFKNDYDYKIISLYCPISEEQTYEWFKKYIDMKFYYNIDFYYIDFESFNKLNIKQFPEFLIINKNNKMVYRGQISYLRYVSDNIYNKLKSVNEKY